MLEQDDQTVKADWKRWDFSCRLKADSLITLKFTTTQ